MSSFENGQEKSSGRAQSSANKLILSLMLCWAAVMLTRSLSSPPTGYLHAWNQVTTLALVRQLSQDASSMLTPHDVVTRVTWERAGEAVNKRDTEARFRCYEEFPLYHLASALVNKIVSGLERSSRLCSIFFWILALYSLIQLARQHAGSQGVLSSVCLYILSFPFLYYGQAIMSDIGMVACGLLAVERLTAWRKSNASKHWYQACICLLLSTLLKSYGLLYVLYFVAASSMGFFRSATWKRRWIVCLLCCAPVILWHLFARTQGGYDESNFRSAGFILQAVLNPRLYTVIVNSWFRYFGYIAGGCALAALLFLFFRRQQCLESTCVTPWWITWSMLIMPLYLLLTADKLFDHDYYFLPVYPPLFVVIGTIVFEKLKFARLPLKNRSWSCILLVLVVSQAIMTTTKIKKAQKPSPDVEICGSIVSQHVPPNSLIATLVDVPRYNSIAYYSKRLAINVEGIAFPLRRYVDAGAEFLVVALPVEELNVMANWIGRDPLKPSLVTENRELTDFSGKSRGCQVYKFRS